MIDKTNTVYLIRKSFIDETTELARCSCLDLAIDICKPGYSIFDEEGNLLHATALECLSEFGKTWESLKSKVEKHINFIETKRFPFIFKKDLLVIDENLNKILQLMNKIEVEESRNVFK